MKKQILFFSAVLFVAKINSQTISYTIDSTCFNALTLESGPTQVRFADINKDGHLDVVSIGDHGSPNISGNQHGITVFFGNGTAANWQLYQSGSYGYGGCAVGDINNDGNPDVACSMHHNYSGQKLIEAKLGDGTGMNWTSYDGGLVTGGETYGMRGTDLGDVNNDGLLDIGSNSMGANQGVHIYKNLGTGNWQHIFSAGQGGGAKNFLQFGDMNGDGNLDFVVSNEFGSAFFGNGNGSFVKKVINLPPVTSAYDSYTDVSLADIDNDGDDDFAFAFDGGIYVYKWNETTQQWDNSSTGLPAPNGYAIARLADLDMDGFADLVTIGADASPNIFTLQIWKGNGGTSWTKTHSISLPTLTAVSDIAIGDADHNGYSDILLWGGHIQSMFTTINQLWLFKADVTAAALNVMETYPQGNECFPNNAIRFIHWVSAVQNNNSSSVKIEYSTTGSSGPWTLIAGSAPNNGTYQWNVPAVNSSNCFIRVTVTDNVSSATAVSINTNPFSIGCNSATGISETNNQNSVSVFPNPSSGIFVIASEAKQSHIEIYNVYGENIYSAEINLPAGQAGSSENKIDLTKQPKGIYFLQVRSENKMQRIKLVVE